MFTQPESGTLICFENENVVALPPSKLAPALALLYMLKVRLQIERFACNKAMKLEVELSQQYNAVDFLTSVCRRFLRYSGGSVLHDISLLYCRQGKPSKIQGPATNGGRWAVHTVPGSAHALLNMARIRLCMASCATGALSELRPGHPHESHLQGCC